MLLLALGSHGQSYIPPYQALVVGITETNSIIVEKEGLRKQVVLAYVALPKKGHPYYQRAKNILIAQLLKRSVRVDPTRQEADYDVALLYVNANNFNLDLVKRGHAAVDVKQNPNPAWYQAEKNAREKNTEIWSHQDWPHPLYHAQTLREMEGYQIVSDHIVTDSDIHAKMRASYIADTTTKLAYPLHCGHIWGLIPYRSRIIFLSEKSLLKKGYTPTKC